MPTHRLSVYDPAMATADVVKVAFRNDRFDREGVAEITHESVSGDLASLFADACEWANHRQADKDAIPLSFSSMLAAMTASEKPLCRWLQRHLALRGVRSVTMTRGWNATGARQLPESPVQTSESFRTAFEMARALFATTPRAPAIDVRHFMAAYAICKDYHLHDFLRLRIDRRAWCLDLAGRLEEWYPEERDAWKRFSSLATAVPILPFSTDAPAGRDLLNIDRETEAFSRLIAARSTITPLSIGVFGAWGSGKSFLMRRIRDRVAEIASVADGEGRGSPYHSKVAQIEFNAWHYSEGTLVACLVDHIFKNLRIGIEDEDDATLRQRGAELILQIDHAKQGLADREHAVDDAETRRRRAQRELEDIEAKMPAEVAAKQRALDTANAALAAANTDLLELQQRRQAAVDAELARAPARAALQVFRDGIANPDVASATHEISKLVEETQQLRIKWFPILLGVGVIGIGFLAAHLMETKIYAQVVSAIAALGTVAAAGRTWLQKLAAIAKRGEAFQAKQAELAQAAIGAVERRFEPALAKLREIVTARADAVTNSTTALAEAKRAPTIKIEELTALERDRAAKIAERDRAGAEVAVRTQALEQLSTSTLLGEFLDNRAETDGYRKNLTIFSQVRNDFERLSKLMARATDDYYQRNKRAPTVSRIVLYIDDLDRCPESKVVEVLRTVHLLLAFPLFVCVVAVDPRWVTQCLRSAPGLIDGTEHESALATEFGQPATPADYLEKIFQIPLWLRPVPSTQRSAIVRALLDPEMTAGASPNLELAAVDAPTGPTVAAGIAMVESGAKAAPVDLQVGAAELDYVDKLGGLLSGNLRGLKRFVNTYHLVKSALSDVEQQVFRGEVRMLGESDDTIRYVPYRLCMAQLAVMCTQRERARKLVALVDSAGPTDGLSRLREQDQELADAIDASLSSRQAAGQLTIETFALWLERTRRYSFYV
jgi:KAP family P-loop domain